MAKITNPALLQQLTSFGQRRLKRGELFLLAQCIANRLPIGVSMPENIRTYTLNLRQQIDGPIYGLTDYIYLPVEDINHLYKMIDALLLWRMSVAHNPAPIYLSGDPTSVVDDLTAILRYVDTGDICSVADVVATASRTALTFQDYLKQYA